MDSKINEGHEPHRHWHVFSLGADLLEYGFRGEDADALMGLRGLPVTQGCRC